MNVKQLSEEFMKVYATERLQPTTIRGYRTNFNKHIIPYIGNTNINEITADTLDTLNSSLNTLNNKSKIYVHATLRKALNFALKRRYIDFNPYNCFDLPRAEKYAYRTLTQEEAHKVIQIVKGTRLEVPVTMALCYGLRRGECLGIQKIDIDEKLNILHISRSKTEVDGNISFKGCKKDSQRSILLDEKHTIMLIGKPLSLIEDLSPTNLDKEFQKLVKQNGLQHLRFHDLRHTYATIMMSKGVNPRIVSAVLGHTKVETTLNLYSHPDVSMQQICIDVFNKK